MRLTVLTAALAVALAALVPAQAAPLEAAPMNAVAAQKTAQAAALGFAQVSLDRNGRVNSLLSNFGAEAGRSGANTAAAATVLHADSGPAVEALFHGELGAIVGMLPGSRMNVQEVKTSAEGIRYYSLRQTYQGIPVVGDEVTVQVGAGGEVQAVFGAAVAVESLRTRPQANADTALRAAAMRAAQRDGALDQTTARNVMTLEGTPRLVVLARSGTAPVLAWESVATLGDARFPRFRATVYADAHSGELLDAYTLIYSALNRRIYDSNNGCYRTGVPASTLVLSEGGSTSGVIAPAVNAYNAFGNVYHYFNTAHGIDSFNDAGATLTAYVRLSIDFGSGCDSGNAAWGNNTMYMGPGNASTNDMASEPDVTYHEFGHGVTNVTSGLAYRNESGGLNEAASDIYAAMVEAWINTLPGGAANANSPIAYAPNADTWTIGEGLRKNGVPFRRMGDPASLNNLDRYSQYVSRFGSCTSPSNSNDQCGVHTSSGIANLAFYLLVNGGRHPGNATNINVAPISFERAARYFFEVNQLRAVNANATFSQFRNAMQARARANASGGLCDEVSIAQAWEAVEVTGAAAQNPNACGGGGNQAPTAAFTATPSDLTVAFNGSGSSDTDGSIASYSWNFGDGTSGSGVNASRTYASAGTYTVTLTVTDNQGATNTRTQQVTVTAANSQCPGAAFSGSFSGANGQSQYQPTGGSYTTTTSGTHTVCLNGPSANDYDVYLQRRSSSGTWSNVASGETSSASERISYSGAAGTYRVRVVNYRGTGAYTGTLQKP